VRAAIYERISKDRTGEEAGVARQDEDCVALAEQLAATVVEKYVDNDTSATNRRKPRKHYLRMLEDIRAGKVDTVICWHTDRLYRQPRELEDLIDLVETHHVLIRACRAGELDLSTPTGRMVARLLGAVAKHEVEHKSDRWLRAVQQNREAGKVPPSRLRMYGYTGATRDGEGALLDAGGKIVADEAERIRWMVKQVLRGSTLASIARKLNDEHVPTVTGSQWHTITIRSLLMHPRIAGHVVWQGEIIAQGQWEPILDEATWNAVRALLAARNGMSGGPRVALLLDLAYCHCGTRMHTGAKTWRTAAGEIRRRRSYRCPIQPPYDVGCRKVSINAEPIEELVEAYAKARLDDPRVRSAIAARNIVAQSADLSAELGELEERYDELKAALTVVKGRAVTDITTAMADLERQINERLKSLKQHGTVALPKRGVWPTDLAQRAALVQMVVGRVWVDPHRTGAPPRFDPNRVRVEPTKMVAQHL
jgi:site-specific DNA recombinase